MHISYTVSAAALTAQSASISTPVGANALTVASISTKLSTVLNEISTDVGAMGWHRGTIRHVSLAARIPAMRAAASASPLGKVPCLSARSARAFSRTAPRAVAARRVARFAEISTIRGWPSRIARTLR